MALYFTGKESVCACGSQYFEKKPYYEVTIEGEMHYLRKVETHLICQACQKTLSVIQEDGSVRIKER